MSTESANIEPDFIIVGAGHSSADYIPDLCKTMGDRLRGVVFIDHDMEEIRTLKAKLDEMNVQNVDVVLRKRVLERERFDELRAELGMEGNTQWGDDIANNPPMIRLQVRLRSQDIFNAVWGMLPTRGGRLLRPQVKLVFAFGMTGMTSSTVALEAGELLRSRMNRHLLNRDVDDAIGAESVIDAPAPIHIGIGLFPPDPNEGAGDFNLPHGLNVSRVINEKLPTVESRPVDMDGMPFNRFFFIDASGFGRTLDLSDFDDWASRTVSTLVLCRAINGESFYDANEFLEEMSPYSNCALILAGVGPDEQPTIKLLREISPEIETIQQSGDNEIHTLVRGLIESTAETAEATLDSPFTRARGALADALQNLVVAISDLEAAETAPLKIPAIWMILGFLLGALVGLAGTFGAEVYVLRYTPVQVIAVLNAIVILICGAVLGAVIGVVLGFFLPRLAESSNKDLRVDAAKRRRQQCLTDLKNALSALKTSVQETIGALQNEWEERQYSRMWLLPPSVNDWVHELDNDALPRMDDNATAAYDALSALNDELQRMLRYIINPNADAEFKVSRGSVLVAGSSDARAAYPTPARSMQSAFGGEWVVMEGEGNLDAAVPLHYLLFWEPEDGRVTPRYYRRRADTRFSLPARFNAWPVQ